ncbi:MAG: class I SAM-dependent methyltransferase [Bdellovibrionales bacterium]|nr:class I SAM-dependent methyltransferase [Bdellovibrionales bacterium]
MNEKINQISDTAFWVSSYRAAESQRKDALFKDPFAEMLSGDKGKHFASMASDSKYASWTVVIRTKVIDEMIDSLIKRDVERIINLGAGLDSRPYRLELPKSLQWIEVDHDHVIQFKEEKMKNTNPNCHLQRIGLDLSQQKERNELFEKLNSKNLKTLILTEGVLPYLTENQVGTLAEDLRLYSNFSYWITEYHSRDMYKHLRNRRKNKEMENSPFQFFPNQWIEFFNNHGWVKKELYFLNEEAKKLNRPFPLPWWAKILHALAPKDELEKLQKMSGFVLWEPIEKE